MTKIFISYSSRDAEQADRYYQALVEQAHEVWMDRAELKGGQEWVHIIQEQIRWADVMLVLWSAHALASTWVGREITFAEGLNKKIIPVQIDATSPRENIIINALQGIDARYLPFETVINKIEQGFGDGSAEIDTPLDATLRKRAAARPGRDPRLIGGGIVILLLAIGGLMVASRGSGSGQLVTLTPQSTLPPTAATPARLTVVPTFPADELDQPATLDRLNAWRAASGLTPLAENAALQAVAEQHISYLRSLPLPELESTNVFRNADGQDVVYMADAAGYAGSVTLFVETSDTPFSLQALLERLDGQEIYTEAGFSQVQAIATGKLYWVLILGTGG
ncbi:MAG: TIR domain-containing protein [Anaerolineae bacterium]|nr:TIR domain-containing protein [Anaerolineae bacterium]